MNKKTHTLFLFALFFRLTSAQVPAPEIVKVSVDAVTGKAQIYWLSNNDPFTEKYRVNKVNRISTNGNPQFDKLYDSEVSYGQDRMSYSYADPDVSNHSIGLTVRAIRPGDEESLVNQIDSTIYLEGYFDACQASVFLNWNEYNSWRGEIERYGVYTSINDGDWQLNKELEDGNTSAVLNGLEENTNYDILIAAIRDNANRDSSTSNKINLLTTMKVLPDYIFANYTTAKNEGQELSFSIDPLGDMDAYNLYRSDEEQGEYELIQTFSDASTTITYFDPAPFLSGPYYYKLEGINFCDNPLVFSDNIASTVVLNGAINNKEVTLAWNAYQNYKMQGARYSVERRYGELPYETIAELTDLAYIDYPLNTTSEEVFSSRVTYRITAMAGVVNSYGVNAAGFSNEKSFELPAAVLFEYNAFVPGGDENGNERFGPTMDFIPDDFLFRIFNQNGYLIFETKNADFPYWYGKINGKFASEGVYAYVVTYKGADGKKQLLSGNVSVTYP